MVGLGLEGPAEVGDGDRLGKLCGDELLKLRGDWREDCWGES